MSVVRLDDALAEVMERTADSGLRIIGVDGPSGSGKSTLAARIATIDRCEGDRAMPGDRAMSGGEAIARAEYL
jgi:ABC-type lipoprotein export system ATPase subunit